MTRAPMRYNAAEHRSKREFTSALYGYVPFLLRTALLVEYIRSLPPIETS
jgi:hypothetical protein